MNEHMIALFNPKGGVGKTTIADELAFSYSKDETVNFLNLDSQPGGQHESSPKGNGGTVTIVDMPGRIEPRVMPVLDEADVVIVPIQPSIKSLAPLRNTLDSIPDTARVIIACNNYDSRFREHTEALASLAKLGIPIITIPRSTLIERAHMDGKAVTVTNPRDSIGKSMAELAELARNTN